ncbi:MAG: BamA/TamA family outer membrane protein [Holosporaceae bacterium]|jgi:translocation and assembly module TamA|nr:BamA/TamA family outer membrane protein [Holosporaceae bacterium]
MVLKRIIFFTLCFVSKIFPQDSEFYNFRYKAELTMKKDQNFIETFADMISESQIIAEIKQLRTFSQQDKPINNMRVLESRVVDDIALMYKKAHFLGFYNARISHKIYNNNSKSTVKIHVNLGKKFNLKLNVHYLNQNKEFNGCYASILQKDLRNFKASIEEIKALIAIAINHLQKDGFFKPKVLEKKVYIDYEAGKAVLNLIIDPGQRVFFSDVDIRSFPDISDDFIKNRIIWEKGEIFNIEKVKLTAENLKNTQIFSKVKVKPNEKSIANGKVSMIIELQEEKKHIIDVGILYTGMRNMNFEKKSQTRKNLKSVVARLTWANCNTFGGGEKLSVITEGTPMKIQEKRSDYAFEVALSLPDIFWKNNTADLRVARRQELTNVFLKKSDCGSLMFNYPLYDNFMMKIGSNIEKNSIDASEIFFRSKDNNKKYENFAIPLEFIVDRTDDLLNPTSGYKITLKFSEMFFRHSTIGKLKTFDMAFSYNYSLDELKYTVLAFNISRKSILGQKIDAIPVDRRIYAGGMDSVRGYASQMATEIIMGEEFPMGGKSSLEYNAEIRRKISVDFGCVVFFDGAKIFQNKSFHEYLQTEKKRWFNSVGLGLRYFTAIGPIRMDLAFPIRKRRKVDSRIQFIMSLGQAF